MVVMLFAGGFGIEKAQVAGGRWLAMRRDRLKPELQQMIPLPVVRTAPASPADVKQ